MQALVEHRGKQFLVTENLELKVPYLGGKEGDKFQLEKILYIDDNKKKEFGKPYLTNLTISGKILSHGRDDKIVVFKMKRRKGHQVKNGHRQDFSIIKIDKFKKSKKKVAASSKKDAKPSTATKKAAAAPKKEKGKDK